MRSRLLLLAAATALCIVAAELALRALGDPPPTNVQSLRTLRGPATIPGLRYQLLPNARFVQRYPSDPRGYFGAAGGVEYAINSFGVRDREYPRAKSAGTRRILAFGDSYTFGTGVRLEDTFAKRLEARLAARADAPRTEVINFGYPGFDTPQEVALLEHQGLAFDPDQVLLCVFLNDAKGGSVRDAFRAPDEAARGFWTRHSRLVRRVAEARRRSAAVDELIASTRASFATDAPGWRTMRRALRHAASLQQPHGFELALVVFPMLYRLDDDYPFEEAHATIAAFADELGVPALDLLDAFRGLDGPSLWVHPVDQHPNERAHAIAAEAIERFLAPRLAER